MSRKSRKVTHLLPSGVACYEVGFLVETHFYNNHFQLELESEDHQVTVILTYSLRMVGIGQQSDQSKLSEGMCGISLAPQPACSFALRA